MPALLQNQQVPLGLQDSPNDFRELSLLLLMLLTKAVLTSTACAGQIDRQSHHPVSDLQHAPHACFQGFPHVLPLLWLQHLVICCLQVAEDLQVSDVDACPF
jgi:hypothetical protein